MPVATYTGWNLRDPKTGLAGERVSFVGSPRPVSGRRGPTGRRTGDPRPIPGGAVRLARTLSRTLRAKRRWRRSASVSSCPRTWRMFFGAAPRSGTPRSGERSETPAGAGGGKALLSAASPPTRGRTLGSWVRPRRATTPERTEVTPDLRGVELRELRRLLLGSSAEPAGRCPAAAAAARSARGGRSLPRKPRGRTFIHRGMIVRVARKRSDDRARRERVAGQADDLVVEVAPGVVLRLRRSWRGCCRGSGTGTEARGRRAGTRGSSGAARPKAERSEYPGKAPGVMSTKRFVSSKGSVPASSRARARSWSGRTGT